jgi:hypothetical protein
LYSCIMIEVEEATTTADETTTPVAVLVVD